MPYHLQVRPVFMVMWHAFQQSIPAVGYEICDVCEVDIGPPINGVNVEPYYSNQDGACIAPNITPTWVSCPNRIGMG